jgi:Amt family ammonium transporter
VPPDRFISLAEDTGLIGPLGSWVLGEAARQLAEWRATLPMAAKLEVTVNLSPAQLREPGLVDEVADTLGEHGLPPAALKLELTESSLVEDPATAAGVLRALKKREVQVYLDDFGTGYSSLSTLHRLPLDALKIDRSFVAGMDGGTTGAHKGAEIVRTIVALARSLGVRVVGEGVESHEQLAALHALGVRLRAGLPDLAAAPGRRVRRVVPDRRSPARLARGPPLHLKSNARRTVRRAAPSRDP